MNTIKPWDARIAYQLIRPFINSGIHPNFFTTLSLILGLSAGFLLAFGSPFAANWGAGLYIVAALIDHCDGELARSTGKTSLFGHYYDNVVGAFNYVLLFVSMGIGQRFSSFGEKAILLGLIAGAAIAVIVSVRLWEEYKGGKSVHDQASFAGFEIEDLLYIVGPIIWLGGIQLFLVAAGIGAPLYMLWALCQFFSQKNARA
jgi:archaetidylinositol phosphate synthase